MAQPMTNQEIEELEALARQYCETAVRYRMHQAAGDLDRDADRKLRQYLNSLDLCLRRLQSANELERMRAWDGDEEAAGDAAERLDGTAPRWRDAL